MDHPVWCREYTGSISLTAPGRNAVSRAAVNNMRSTLLFALSVVMLAAMAASAQAGDIHSERVHFKKGASEARIEGHLQGYETLDYVLGARAGQEMVVTLHTDNTANYFNLMAPGETEVAFFIGSRDGERFQGELPATGDYRIRIYLMRSAARRNEQAHFRLDVAITGPAQSKTDTEDALVAGTPFHATGEVPCARSAGQLMGSCRFGVQRLDGGSARLTLFWPDGGSRVILFEHGEATGTEPQESDFSVERQSDLNIIRNGEERYEIPDAVIFGG
jgi:hypothetical protein